MWMIWMILKAMRWDECMKGVEQREERCRNQDPGLQGWRPEDGEAAGKEAEEEWPVRWPGQLLPSWFHQLD